MADPRESSTDEEDEGQEVGTANAGTALSRAADEDNTEGGFVR